jgi:hypothetical protein
MVWFDHSAAKRPIRVNIQMRIGNNEYCLVRTSLVVQGEKRFEAALELAVMYPALSRRYADLRPR